MSKLLSIREAADLLGVSTSTLRRWEREGKLCPERTAGNQRRYHAAQLKPHAIHQKPFINKKTIAYLAIGKWFNFLNKWLILT